MTMARAHLVDPSVTRSTLADEVRPATLGSADIHTSRAYND
jgi:hypothetical protein